MIVNVINLPKRTDRRELILQEAEEQKFRLVFWNGITTNNRPFTNISRAHKQIVRNALEQKIPEVIIAEDDIKFTHPKGFKYFLSQKPKNFDLYMGVIYAGHVENKRVMNGFSGGLSLYIIPQHFYQVFLSADEGNHLDRWLGGIAHKHQFYVCDPMVVQQRGGYSDNLKRNMEYGAYHEKRNFYCG